MNRELWQFLWQDLQPIEGDLQWASLERFAEVVAAEPDWIDESFVAFDRAREAVLDQASCVHLHVPAILALAAPKLDDAQRLKAGRFLLDRFLDAGEEDDHLLMEVLVAACGSMGPVVLPLVLEAADREVEPSSAWGRLWGLTRLAIDAEDRGVRALVAQSCADLLDRVARDELEFELGIEAAWTLARMRQEDSAELLRRLEHASQWTLTHADYRAARRCLEGDCRDAPDPELWELPVRDWFEPRWQRVRTWLLVRDSGGTWEPQRGWGARREASLPIPIREHSPQTGPGSTCPCGTAAAT